MTIQLDHLIVPSHTKIASAKLLAELLGVPWGEAAAGPFTAVYVNDGLTLDFIETEDPLPIHHYCFRAEPHEFASILERIKAAQIKYRSTVRGPIDMQVNPQFGNIYWNEPDGHQWEMLTVSYARRPSQES